MSDPDWTSGLNRVGQYFEGYVEDIDLIRQKHQAATVTTYGVRRSRSNATIGASNENSCNFFFFFFFFLLYGVNTPKVCW